MATKRIDYIDAIKGFSVLWVVLYHFDLTGVAINAPLRLPLFSWYPDCFSDNGVVLRTFYQESEYTFSTLCVLLVIRNNFATFGAVCTLSV